MATLFHCPLKVIVKLIVAATTGIIIPALPTMATVCNHQAIGAKINVPTHQISDTELEVNLNGLSIGLYILHLNGKQWKIIKEKE